MNQQHVLDTGDFAEVPAEQREDVDGYDPDDYGGVPVFRIEPPRAG